MRYHRLSRDLVRDHLVRRRWMPVHQHLVPARRWPAMLAVVAVVTAGCASPPSPLPEEQDMPGGWCGSEQENLTLKADDTFEITQLKPPAAGPQCDALA